MQARKQNDYKRQPAQKRLTITRKMLRKLKYLTPVLAVATLHGQALPDHPKPRTVDFALYAADVTVRSLDIASTHKLLADPCHCYKELDPVAPHTANPAILTAFQYGAAAGIIFGTRYFERHGHKRIARALLIADIVSESVAVGRNYSLSHPHPSLNVQSKPAGEPVKVVYR
jgi:hypothetical protein